MAIPIIITPYDSEVIKRCFITTEIRDKENTVYTEEVSNEKVVIYVQNFLGRLSFFFENQRRLLS